MKIELLAPAGNLLKLKYAFAFGADAVYIGGEELSLRTASDNFTFDEMAEGINFAHSKGKKVYVAMNIFPHNDDLALFKQYAMKLHELKADGVIVSDLGALRMVKDHAPNLEIHISTQANCINYMTCNEYYKLGAKRVVLARELSLAEIKTIRENTPKDLELEAFVHGAMCISYSGRCLLSSYMIGRDANKGDCAQSCRWNYSLMEEKRPSEYFPVYENDNGTFIFNSKDLCMINHIKELSDAGITSFKIEGRVKSEFYVASVIKPYRKEIDRYLKDPSNYTPDESQSEELEKVSHRDYYTGFYFENPYENGQVYTENSYLRSYDIIGVVEEVIDGMLIIGQRNKFSVGEEVEIFSPNEENINFTVNEMFDEKDNPIETAPHSTMTVKIPFDQKAEKYSILRRKRL